MHFNVILPFTPMSSSGLFPSDFPTKVLYAFLFLIWNRTFPVQIPRPANLRRCTLSVPVLLCGCSVWPSSVTFLTLHWNLLTTLPSALFVPSLITNIAALRQNKVLI
jgi:hypothetical protein